MEIHLNSGEVIEIGLLDCPFCGSQPDVENIGNEHTKSRKIKIRCSGCRVERVNAAINHSSSWLLERSVEQWNKRPIKAKG